MTPPKIGSWNCIAAALVLLSTACGQSPYRDTRKASPAGGAGGSPSEPGGSENSGTAGSAPEECGFTVESSISDNISTVGIVSWSVELPQIESAHIDFGLDTSYGMTAPVNLDEPNFRTLLLGMKANRDYHFRIVAEAGDTVCHSADRVVSTGALPTNLPNVTVTTNDSDALAGGFLITGTYQGGPIYILDVDGDFVWWYERPNMVRAKMTYDGSRMWMAWGRSMTRVSMDGYEFEDLSDQFPGLTHDFTVLPDESVFFISQRDLARVLVERAPDGTVHDVADPCYPFAAAGRECKANALQYSPEDDTLVVSEPVNKAYVKIARDGEFVWVLQPAGWPDGSFTTDESWFRANHGLDVLALDRLLFFNNAEDDDPDGSRVIEMYLDLETMVATKLWEYVASPPITNIFLGDVQRLDNGNTLVTYSAQGIIHEIDAAGTVLQSMSFALGQAVGYSTKRQSLYGPPPR